MATIAIGSRLAAAGRKTVVVTGAQGRESASGQADSIRCDLADRQRLLEACRAADAIIHLAAQHWDCDFHSKLLPDNLEACYNVFEAACEAGVSRVVFASSLHVVNGCIVGMHGNPVRQAKLG